MSAKQSRKKDGFSTQTFAWKHWWGEWLDLSNKKLLLICKKPMYLWEKTDFYIYDYIWQQYCIWQICPLPIGGLVLKSDDEPPQPTPSAFHIISCVCDTLATERLPRDAVKHQSRKRDKNLTQLSQLIPSWSPFLRQTQLSLFSGFLLPPEENLFFFLATESDLRLNSQ